jgi:hypothetical protein
MSTRREALEAAFEGLENEDDEKLGKTPPGDEEGAGLAAGDDQGGDEDPNASGEADEEGKKPLEGKKPDDKPKPKVESADEKERKAAAKLGDRTGKTPAEDTKSVGTRAPDSWSPAAREKWGAIPADVRATILKREGEIKRTLSETDNVRRFSNDLAKVINPHLPFIQASGSNPLGAIQSLLGTASQLYGGNVDTKAGIVAQLIWRYGVDIKTLDTILSKKQLPNGGGPEQIGRGPEAPPAWAQPLFGFMNQAQQARQQAEQRQVQEAAAEIEQVENEWPYFNDLREEVADLMEAAYNRGRVLSLKQAYDRAVMLNPEISQILEQRKLASRQTPQNLQRARRAASTIKGGSPNGGAAGGKNKPASRREALEAAWDDAET